MNALQFRLEPAGFRGNQVYSMRIPGIAAAPAVTLAVAIAWAQPSLAQDAKSRSKPAAATPMALMVKAAPARSATLANDLITIAGRNLCLEQATLIRQTGKSRY